MNNLVLRTMSGIVLVVVLIGGIIWCDISRFVVLSLIGVATLWEMLGLFARNGVPLCAKGWYVIISAVALLISNFLYYPIFWSLALLYLLIRFSLELYGKNKKPLESIGYEIFALIYTILPIVLLTHMPQSTVLLIFILVWTNDVGAYLIGSQLGKRRLFERISPKKSWEGFWGGVIMVAIVAVSLGYYWLDTPILESLFLGVTVSVASVYGDLFESMFKRSVGVKDSGNTIPGHGGFWDRFDALFFAVPAYYAMKEIIPILF